MWSVTLSVFVECVREILSLMVENIENMHGCRYWWMQDPGNSFGSKICIVVLCTQTSSIIQTGIATKEKIAEKASLHSRHKRGNLRNNIVPFVVFLQLAVRFQGPLWP